MIKRIVCICCKTYLDAYKNPYPYSIEQIIANQREFNRLAYLVGWDQIEINGGEMTDDWLCPKCIDEGDKNV